MQCLRCLASRAKKQSGPHDSYRHRRYALATIIALINASAYNYTMQCANFQRSSEFGMGPSSGTRVQALSTGQKYCAFELTRSCIVSHVEPTVAYRQPILWTDNNRSHSIPDRFDQHFIVHGATLFCSFPKSQLREYSTWTRGLCVTIEVT